MRNPLPFLLQIMIFFMRYFVIKLIVKNLEINFVKFTCYQIKYIF